MGSKLGQRRLDDGREHGLARVRRDVFAHAAQQAAGVVGGRRGRMAAVGVRRDGEVHVALLGNADHGHGHVNPQGRVGRHSAALVEHHRRVDAVGAEPLDGVRTGGRRDLLAVA